MIIYIYSLYNRNAAGTEEEEEQRTNLEADPDWWRQEQPQKEIRGRVGASRWGQFSAIVL